MEFGVVLPHVGPQARAQVVERIQRMARHAEALGYHSVWVADHIAMPVHLVSKYPYHPEGKFLVDVTDNFLEPLTVLGYVAACTSRVRLGTGVLVIPYRNPVVTAKVVSTLDVLSNGRVIVGAGVGWMAEEFAYLNVPYRERGARTDEYLHIMKTLWTQEEPRFQGRFFTFADLRCEPRPVQKPHPPIWIGGHSQAALRRAATLGDGWYGHVFWRDPEQLPREIRTIKRFAEQAGRDPEALTYAAPAYERTFEDVLRSLPRYQQAGLDHVVLAFFLWTDGFDEVLGQMERFAREVGLQPAG
ncbi:MAG: TIGR03619 family F420-dependent LLM class oxidoreductase [Candidatus Binatia bacterium]|nr:TIGR03619 family F420-dependent LLM class oxidoreductase [Candidatus Binatia bacterium]